ncbi:glutamate-5-semialdehyde dehydrogenase [Liquorilactobacillus mali]|uniref:Gamma-glutamyl phosphate reductase n=1 Tax=Liquorilactobacillus mali KCTC 3596 = DSM 20444 TaxID=1046596 RepID=J0L3B5_9LACO|nr:glutamate-5-semialdehyde dehydrogenase [Liquorilactobacillus mali]EJE97500.1 gamma-glutamyl phosphate reductase [Liquorilactobacillus mali KCTC 3596 = DSM 20444]KRN09999.1 gamma-glutamyl phosphate reductase [Liquorilactobacillus mali KCTC 3596 = DSM 20444]QFQ73828.1 glutamate-5-semialdehyde dehydrogenase [Liquorilactobacillus mali]
MKIDLEKIGSQAKNAAYELSLVSAEDKNKVLLAMADALRSNSSEILAANQRDLSGATGLIKSFVDRLTLDEERIEKIAQGLGQVAQLSDPLGNVTNGWINHAGLQITQKRVPLGVVGIIYEARPNVTVDAAALCFKSGNAVILRGGKEAFNTNLKLVEVLQATLKENGYSENTIQVLTDTSHEVANKFMQLTGYLDVLIPRGGAKLIQTVVQNAKVPVIETGVGNCHIYVDKTADFEMAKKIIVNAKCQRPAVCNAAEKLLIHEDVASEYLPGIVAELKKYNVEIRADQAALDILQGSAIPATEEDWDTEYNDYILGVKVVSSVDEAIKHINQHGTKHSEAIVTNDYKKSQQFLDQIDAAAVYVNASTRFTDGFEYGFGAEIGISTQKLHARGPMGLEALTTTKYVVRGNGQIRE